MRLLLAGGGTGGHLFPAVALAQRLLLQDQESEVLFVGTEQGLEARMLPKLGLPLQTVNMAGVVGRGWRGKLELLPRLWQSMQQATRIIRSFQPDLVLGVGGYASVPVLLTAKRLGLPFLIHEQNAIPGLSNRLLGRWATKIFLSFGGSGKQFDARKTVLTGNPLRPGLEEVAKQLPGKGKLLIFGGSRGARAINQAIMAMLPILQGWPEIPEILHQTGEEDLLQVREAYRTAGFDPLQVVAFIDDMATAYAEAGLIICRAGATTLAEITACGRPAILIPYPYAAGDHQTANAQALVAVGAAVICPQSELTPESLAEQVKNLLLNQDYLQVMADRARRMGNPGAADRILNECRKLLGTPQIQVG